MNGDIKDQENSTAESKNRRSSFGSFLLIVAISAVIGFVTILPGKNNHIKDFPSLKQILVRELFFIGIPVVLGIFISKMNKSYKRKIDSGK